MDKLMQYVPGPDLPTGGIIIDSRLSKSPRPIAPAAEVSGCARGGKPRRPAVAPGRSSSPKCPTRCKSRRLVEKIAELLSERKLPLLGDVRDESAEDVRLVLEPKSRTVDPGSADGSDVQALTDLENALSLNMNVLSGGRVPKVMGLRRRAAPNGWITAARSLCAARTTVWQDRAAALKCFGLPDRLSQYRRGDPHHPDEDEPKRC
jgi:topoisomerase-4 subunit A